ncbi:lysozyme inhibitor LprI family protein [Caulobacter sp. CCG-8]|uniref:lysozyme inhibitor LprI family protein n=1 Tax=Caulobacter sp. CCG-8 TaxID=3127958 RepID=UPI00307DC597
MRPLVIALALTFVAPVAAPSLARAASFDCQRAKSADEKAVCAYLPLNDKDVRMSVLYEINKHTLAMGGRDALQDQQRQWLTERRRCGANRSCLIRLYDRRLGELEKTTERIYHAGPF